MLRIALSSCLLAAVALFLLAPHELAAKSAGAGFGARAFHAGVHRGAHRGNHRAVPWAGGYGYASAPYYSSDYIGDGQPVVIVLPPPEPPHQLNCTRSQETVSVPSADGGIREIGVRRC